MFWPLNSNGNYILAVGSYNDVTASPDWEGIRGANGLPNVTILEDETASTGVYASNGSLNVVEATTFGVYSPTGAYNAEILEPPEE